MSQSCCVVWEYQDENGCWNGFERHYSDTLEDMHIRIMAERRNHPEFLNMGNYLGVPTMASLCSTRQVLLTVSKSYEMGRVRCMEGSLPALGITWQWFDGTVGKWKLYNQSVSLTLETARLSNAPNCSVDLSLCPPSVPVSIDVSAMIQVNSLTNVRSHIKREQGEPYRLRHGFAITRLLPQGPVDPNRVSGFAIPNTSSFQLFPMQNAFAFQNSTSPIRLQNSASPGVLSHQDYSTSFLPIPRIPLGVYVPQPPRDPSAVNTPQFHSNPTLQMTPLDNVPASTATRGRKRTSGASASNQPPPKYPAHSSNRNLSLSMPAPVNIGNAAASTSSYSSITNQIGAQGSMPVSSNQLQPGAVQRPVTNRRRTVLSASSQTAQGRYRIENTSLSLTFESVWRLGVMFPTQEFPEEDCSICYNQLNEDSNYGQQDVNQPAVVMLNGCKHFYHLECLKAMYNSGTKSGSLQCPQCKTIYGVKRGNCPYGFMEIKTIVPSLPGFHGCNTIVISYHIKEGIQGEDHLNPGKKYTARGFPRSCYLPNNSEGKEILKLLIKAWKRRLTFTVGSSVTTGESDTVVWNEIHHKTEMVNQFGHGYPDPTYFKNVREELRNQGVRCDDGDDDGGQEYIL